MQKNKLKTILNFWMKNANYNGISLRDLEKFSSPKTKLHFFSHLTPAFSLREPTKCKAESLSEKIGNGTTKSMLLTKKKNEFTNNFNLGKIVNEPHIVLAYWKPQSQCAAAMGAWTTARWKYLLGCG